MSSEMIAICDEEVKYLLSKQAIEIRDDGYGFISSLFVIPKSSGGLQPIINLKPLNAFMKY